MKNRRQVYCESRINQLRSELHRIIENEQLTSSNVQKLSRELDELIMMYYRQRKEFKSSVC